MSNDFLKSFKYILIVMLSVALLITLLAVVETLRGKKGISLVDLKLVIPILATVIILLIIVNKALKKK